MPSEELRLRLKEARERKESEVLPGRLAGVRCLGYRQAADLPDWIPAKISAFIRTDSVPTTAISEDAGPERVNAWLESFAHGRGLGTHVLLRTGMTFFPWLECRLPESGWATVVREVLGDDLFVVSADGNVLVVMFAEEYDYQGFAAHAPR